MTECPTCGETFKNRQGMRIHHATVHDESLVEPEETDCEHCGQTYLVGPGDRGRFCSRECWRAAASNRVTIECEGCGSTFEVKGHLEEKRKYCSRECYWETSSETETVQCAGCGRSITVSTTYGIEHCSRACMAEVRTGAPRPDDLDGLLWLLYVYEDHTARQTWLRANAARADDAEWLYKEDVKERLRENDWMEGGGRAKYENLTIEDVGLEPTEPEDGVNNWRKYYGETEGSA